MSANLLLYNLLHIHVLALSVIGFMVCHRNIRAGSPVANLLHAGIQISAE